RHTRFSRDWSSDVCSSDLVIEKPDMALLDIMMPNLDGFTLCQMIRRNPHTENLPVVFVTAYPALDLEDRRRDAGADYILHKPIKIGRASCRERVEYTVGGD